MNYKSLLSVGEEFEYPLTSKWEDLYKILPTLNEKYSINLTQQDFFNCYTKPLPTGEIGIIAINKNGNKVFTIKNSNSINYSDVQELPYLESISNKLKLLKPVDFKQELDFLKTIPTNTMVSYNLITSKAIVNIWRLLCAHSEEDWDIVSTNKSVDNFILRYYGPGDKVPSQYGIFDADLIVSIIDLKRQDTYSSYCLRNKIYHVYNNGYRFRY